MLASEPATLYFERAPAGVLDAMRRVGAAVRPAEFVEAVAAAWRATHPVRDRDVQARFRAGRACRDFLALVALAAAAARSARVLAIGCGRGFVGRGPGYAAAVAREALPAGASGVLDQLDLLPSPDRAPEQAYDLVVTHSILHFFHDLAPVCRFVAAAIAPGGAWVMGNEPNARFWSNPEATLWMENAGKARGRLRSLGRAVSPARCWSRLRRMGTRRAGGSWADEANAFLRGRLGLSGDLTPKEIVRIIDPLMPDPYPGECPIGAQGVSWADLESGPLAGFRLESVRTSGYVLRDNPDRVPRLWRAIDEDLAARYPLDGCAFAAAWRKPL